MRQKSVGNVAPKVVHKPKPRALLVPPPLLLPRGHFKRARLLHPLAERARRGTLFRHVNQPNQKPVAERQRALLDRPPHRALHNVVVRPKQRALPPPNVLNPLPPVPPQPVGLFPDAPTYQKLHRCRTPIQKSDGNCSHTLSRQARIQLCLT